MTDSDKAIQYAAAAGNPPQGKLNPYPFALSRVEGLRESFQLVRLYGNGIGNRCRSNRSTGSPLAQSGIKFEVQFTVGLLYRTLPKSPGIS